MDRLAPQRRLQPVGDVPPDLAADMDRALAERGIESHRALDRGGCGERAADDLDERDQMRRVERVADHAPAGMAAERIAGR